MFPAVDVSCEYILIDLWTSCECRGNKSKILANHAPIMKMEIPAVDGGSIYTTAADNSCEIHLDRNVHLLPSASIGIGAVSRIGSRGWYNELLE